jgi:hypothetical protein
MAERVFELAAAGLNGYEMARQLGRPRSTVADVLRRGQQRAVSGTQWVGDGRRAHYRGRTDVAAVP